MALYSAHDAGVWWTSRVEIASALARLLCMQQLNTMDYAKALKLAQNLADSWSEIQPSDAIRTRASLLVQRYDLRASDSLQLAAALEWCQDAPSGRILLTADRRLREAALLSGFDAKHL
ncbi:MAG TPA: type II toxin-antitoxin system VapC family toxin [Terriglobales bacterium]|nr:type II toxin-antitoxin system VapC family toxin [Terriglobales bacterium]